MKRTRILLVEDIPSLSMLLTTMLRAALYEVVSAQSVLEAQVRFEKFKPDIVLMDLRLPDGDGLELMRELLEIAPSTHFIAITSDGSIDRAVEAMQAGAYDFLVKPIRESRLLEVVKNANTIRKSASFPEQKTNDNPQGFLIGSSVAMASIFKTIASVASSNATVFITGESGTGKNLCAEEIHKRSPRSDKKFVTLNCGSIPRESLGAEIFGHVKGAYAGAHTDRKGAALDADGGTLFLDNVDELDLGFQARLLNLLETYSVHQIGAANPKPIDIRFICSTAGDPHIAMQEGRLREDLFYRLLIVPIHMPALRRRDDDVVEIARKMLLLFSNSENKNFTGLSNEVEELFKDLIWPGNVRQLLNALWNVVVLNDGPIVTPKMLPRDIYREMSRAQYTTDQQAKLPPNQSEKFANMSLAEIERTIIEDVLRQNNGSVPKASRVLDVSPSTLYRKLESWGAGGKNS